MPVVSSQRKNYYPHFDRPLGASLLQDDRWTSLHYAAHAGHAACCMALLAAGAEVGATTLYEQSALHLAAREGHADCIGVLISHGADATARDDVSTPD